MTRFAARGWQPATAGDRLPPVHGVVVTLLLIVVAVDAHRVPDVGGGGLRAGSGFWPAGGAGLEAGVCAARVSDTLVAEGGPSNLASKAATQPAASRVAAMTVMEPRRESCIAPPRRMSRTSSPAGSMAALTTGRGRSSRSWENDVSQSFA